MTLTFRLKETYYMAKRKYTTAEREEVLTAVAAGSTIKAAALHFAIPESTVRANMRLVAYPKCH